MCGHEESRSTGGTLYNYVVIRRTSRGEQSQIYSFLDRVMSSLFEFLNSNALQ